jgi:DNA-binding MarR family transcriptional regulator
VSASPLVPGLERLAIVLVGITARAVADVAPELTLLQWRVLMVVAGKPDGVAVGAIAEALGSKLPATSRLVGRMREHGLVETTRAEADARVTLVRLTPDGRALRRRVVDRRRSQLERAIRDAGNPGATADAVRALAASLESVA